MKGFAGLCQAVGHQFGTSSTTFMRGRTKTLRDYASGIGWRRMVQSLCDSVLLGSLR